MRELIASLNDNVYATLLVVKRTIRDINALTAARVMKKMSNIGRFAEIV